MSISPLNIAIGTYDGTVVGLSLDSEAEDTSLTLQTHFASDVHASAVRACALRGTDLVTGGADEVIRVFDVGKRVEVGTLLHHEGTITSLTFVHDHGRNLLFSSSDDAAICVWRVSDWHLLKRLTGHQAGIVDVAVHPSAAVALSVSQDRALFMWNLARGKIAFSVKTKGSSPPSAIRWSPDGDSYALFSGPLVTLSDLSGKNVRTFSHTHPILCAQFVNQHTFVTGGEDKTVTLWDSRQAHSVNGKETGNGSIPSANGSIKFSGCNHESRICDISLVDDIVLAADASGGLKIWDYRMGGQPRIETNMATKSHLTCMVASHQEWKAPTPVSDVAADEDVKASSKSSKGRKTRVINGNQGKDKAPSRERSLEGTASQRKRKKRKLLQEKQKQAGVE